MAMKQQQPVKRFRVGSCHRDSAASYSTDEAVDEGAIYTLLKRKAVRPEGKLQFCCRYERLSPPSVGVQQNFLSS